MVRPDDRLGLFLEGAPAAVAYTFDPNVDEVLGMFAFLKSKLKLALFNLF